MAYTELFPRSFSTNPNSHEPLSAYTSFLDKMKRSFYNTLCWEAPDSECGASDTHVPRPKPAEFNMHREDIYSAMKKVGDNVVKKCGDYLKERVPSHRKSRDCREHTASSGGKRRSVFSGDARDDSFHRIDRLVETYRKEAKDYKKRSMELMYERDAERKKATRDVDKYAHVERHKSRGRKRWEGQEMAVQRLDTHVPHKEEGKKVRQIYELSEEQCRNFKDKGYVKVNVRVRPNVSVSDFDIIIRRDKPTKRETSEG